MITRPGTIELQAAACAACDLQQSQQPSPQHSQPSQVQQQQSSLQRQHSQQAMPSQKGRQNPLRRRGGGP
jgi:hypothetical protein